MFKSHGFRGALPILRKRGYNDKVLERAGGQFEAEAETAAEVESGGPAHPDGGTEGDLVDISTELYAMPHTPRTEDEVEAQALLYAISKTPREIRAEKETQDVLNRVRVFRAEAAADRGRLGRLIDVRRGLSDIDAAEGMPRGAEGMEATSVVAAQGEPVTRLFEEMTNEQLVRDYGWTLRKAKADRRTRKRRSRHGHYQRSGESDHMKTISEVDEEGGEDGDDGD